MWKKKLDEKGEQSKLNTTAETQKKINMGKQGRKKKEACSGKLLTGECVMRCYRKVE